MGDGKRIDVWEDKWLKKSPSSKVQLPDLVEPTPMKMEKLLLEDKREWNMEMVREILTQNDADMVSKIPLSKQCSPDRLIWSDSITGEFKVKSTYYVARRCLGKREIHRVDRKKIWRKIWMAKVALKVKLFVWRVVQRIILTKTRLNQKGVSGDSNCAVCGIQFETLKHIFFDCPLNRSIWDDVCLKDRKSVV